MTGHGLRASVRAGQTDAAKRGKFSRSRNVDADDRAIVTSTDRRVLRTNLLSKTLLYNVSNRRRRPSFNCDARSELPGAI